MKRQRYFPSTRSAEPEWFTNFADKVTVPATALGFAAPDITAVVGDAKFCAYTSGVWLAQVKEFAPAATAALENLYHGTAPGAVVLPVFTAPALPAGVVPVPAGALDRIFRFVGDFKNKVGYTEAMGQDLGIIGAEETLPDLPEFSLQVETGIGCDCVRVRFKKYGRLGVVVESRRGNGPWEVLGIDTATPYLDERPLLVAGTPEVREYRLRFWDGTPTGDYTAVQRVTVAPA